MALEFADKNVLLVDGLFPCSLLRLATTEDLHLPRQYSTRYDVKGNHTNGEGCWCQEGCRRKLRSSHQVCSLLFP
jgi:hypothetical protein